MPAYRAIDDRARFPLIFAGSSSAPGRGRLVQRHSLAARQEPNSLRAAVIGDAQIDGRRAQVGVPEQRLDGVDVSAAASTSVAKEWRNLWAVARSTPAAMPHARMRARGGPARSAGGHVERYAGPGAAERAALDGRHGAARSAGPRAPYVVVVTAPGRLFTNRAVSTTSSFTVLSSQARFWSSMFGISPCQTAREAPNLSDYSGSSMVGQGRPRQGNVRAEEHPGD